jgi:HAD superfamily hydrolase (TIGR01490 family)
MTLTLFDLDHTLLAGDSDVLWCAFLLARNELDRAVFEPKNVAMEAAYRTGSVSAREFCDFYVGTLAGRSAAEWEPLRRSFLETQIVPRLPASAHELVARHRDAGDLVVMTTATNRFITELTAAHLRIEHLIATECEVGADGRFSGCTAGVLNMREGKLERLHTWLAGRGLRLQDTDSTAYSDSINDLPLLCAVQHAVVVNPDPRLATEARSRGWARHDLHRVS